MKNNKNNNTYILIIIVIIVLFFLLFTISFGKFNGDYTVLNDNVDIFDININCECSNNKECNGNVDKDNINDNVVDGNINNDINDNIDEDNDDIPVFNEITDPNLLGQVFAGDENGNYIYQQKLNIFNNLSYNYSNKIAPGVSSIYNFKVYNNGNSNLKYYIEMYENTEYNINMKYRLKRNNDYIIGNENSWVFASELKSNFLKIESSKYDNYSLEWKWFDDDVNDTVAGKNMTSEYKLNIRLYFEVATDD